MSSHRREHVAGHGAFAVGRALPEDRALLGDLDLIPLTRDVVDQAAEVGETLLRCLDAVHLASALSIRDDISAFIAYDQRLADAATAAGLKAVSPGI